MLTSMKWLLLRDLLACNTEIAAKIERGQMRTGTVHDVQIFTSSQNGVIDRPFSRLKMLKIWLSSQHEPGLLRLIVLKLYCRCNICQ